MQLVPRWLQSRLTPREGFHPRALSGRAVLGGLVTGCRGGRGICLAWAVLTRSDACRLLDDWVRGGRAVPGGRWHLWDSCQSLAVLRLSWGCLADDRLKLRARLVWWWRLVVCSQGTTLAGGAPQWMEMAANADFDRVLCCAIKTMQQKQAASRRPRID